MKHLNVVSEQTSAIADPRYLLEWSTQQFEGAIALATSLGNQTLVIIDMLYQLSHNQAPEFTLDFDKTVLFDHLLSQA